MVHETVQEITQYYSTTLYGNMPSKFKTNQNHFKFRVDLVQALLIEHGSESVRKFQGHHSTDKNVPRLIERHFPERIPPTEKKAGQQRGV